MFRRAEHDDEFERQDTPADSESPLTSPNDPSGTTYDNPYADVASYGVGEPGGPPPPVFGHHSSALRSAEASVIAADAVWTGTLRSNGSIQIFGRVEGEIMAAGDVQIAQGAVVISEIQAINVIIAGTFKGRVACTGRFEALESGAVEGHILAPTLVVHDGATVTGTFRMRGDTDDEESGPFDDVTSSGE